MKIREAYEILRTEGNRRDCSYLFAWTRDEAEMMLEDSSYSYRKVRVLWDGRAWFKIGELTHLNEPVKTLPERVAELKIGSYVGVATNGRLDKVCRLNRRAKGMLYTTIVNGAWSLSFNAQTLSSTKNGNIHKIICIDELPIDIVTNFKSHIGHELMPYIEQALEFYEERVGT